MPVRTLVLAATLAALCPTACSMRRFAVNRIGDALATGGSTFETDDDVELVGEALPFGLKLIESLLAESPQHEGLLLAGCRGFTLYAYGYVQQEADRTASEDLERANALRRRARRLFERASAYGFRALERRYPGMRQALEKDPVQALHVVRDTRHVPLLYWNAAALGLAISAARGDAAMLARLPEVEALIDRALALDERWNDGAIHEFQVIYASSRPGAGGFDATRLRKHFERAVELSGGAQGKRLRRLCRNRSGSRAEPGRVPPHARARARDRPGQGRTEPADEPDCAAPSAVAARPDRRALSRGGSL